jgi:mRNA-degrading endonuclease toxin of MazEF toxin-antitoxin module
VIYSTEKPPSILPGEDLDNVAIPVTLEQGEPEFHPTSRVNYSQVYTVQHNVKVKKVGKVSSDDMKWVKRYWQAYITDND